MSNSTVPLSTRSIKCRLIQNCAVRHCSVLNRKVAAVLKSTALSSAAYVLFYYRFLESKADAAYIGVRFIVRKVRYTRNVLLNKPL